MAEMYKCHNCGWKGPEDELTTRTVDLESYYGVGGLFSNHNYTDETCCPNCGEFDELEDLGYGDEDQEDEEDE
jgi:rubredoxin